ncbi:lactonase family protein [[Actinomadura] parvosata]|uniref:lactonase family protein n=1 Tax=[Actinomadura] parvosata TaxID=1955412 RepID=UPI00406C69DD
MVAPDYTGTRSGGELGLSRDGRFLYATSRGTENAIVVYAVARVSGRLTLVQRVPSGGLASWTFSIHRGGRWMLVANQASGTVNLFGIDRSSGRVTDAGTSIPVPAPDCITFA